MLKLPKGCVGPVVFLLLFLLREGKMVSGRFWMRIVPGLPLPPGLLKAMMSIMFPDTSSGIVWDWGGVYFFLI